MENKFLITLYSLFVIMSFILTVTTNGLISILWLCLLCYYGCLLWEEFVRYKKDKLWS